MDSAMISALSHLDRISEYFRKFDQHDVANEIGRLSVQIVESVDKGILRMHRGGTVVEKMNTIGPNAVTHQPASYHQAQQQLLQSTVRNSLQENTVNAVNNSGGPRTMVSHVNSFRQVQQQTMEGARNLSSGTGLGVVKTNGDHHERANHAASPRPIQQQAVIALMNEVQKKQKLPVNMKMRALQNNSAPSEVAAQLSSWAQIAGSRAPGPSLERAQSSSPESMTSGPSVNAGQGQIGGSTGRELAVLTPAESEIPEERAGIIRIYGSITRDFIRHLTTCIHEGPLFEIRVETNGRARVIFQHVSQALEFLASDKTMVKETGYGRLGAGYRVELAEIVDWNDELRLMNQPIRQRRRLSFARKRLFAENMSPERWRQDIYSIAGQGNVEFLWVFNSGNATAVFTSTAVARKVLDTINRWKDCRVAYSGVSVTYSSDPCEKDLQLVKGNNRSGYGKYRRSR